LSLLQLLIACGPQATEDKPAKDKSSSPTAPTVSDCASFSACGGNVAGRWRVRSACVGAVANPACPGYASNRTTSGTAIYDFGADGVLRYEGSINVGYDISVDESCTQAIAHKDAAAYCKLVEGSSDDNPRVPSTITCSASDGRCSCHVDQGPITAAEDSSYALDGNTLTLLAGGNATSLGYCVSGSSLTLGTPAGDPAIVMVRF
jgi:hypothetical protein